MLAIALLATLPAHAQQAETAVPGYTSNTVPNTVQLEPIVVTATRRAEPLQKVPVAVSVLNGDQLEQANRNNLGAIASQVPTLNFRTGASNKDTSLFIRGVGTVSTSPGVEPTIASVVDGVFLARPGQATLDLLDVDRIEVLRGPQGTLFGKNASAGVINIITREPSRQLEGYVDASYFEGNERRLRAGLSGELQPGTLRGSLTLLHGEYDGNVTNVYDHSTVNGYRTDGARAKLLLTPSTDLKLSFAADHVNSRNTTPTGVVTSTQLVAYPSGAVTHFPAFAAALGPVVPSPDNRQINSNLDTHAGDTHDGLSGQVDWQVAGHTLTSITAYRRWRNSQFQDGDRLSQVFQEFPQSHDHGELRFKQVSQELRLASDPGRDFSYVTGLFYLHTQDDETYRRDVVRCSNSTAAPIAPGATPCPAGQATFSNDFGDAAYGTRSDSAALFGEASYRFTPALRGLAGLRATHERLEYTHERTSTSATAFPGVNPAIANAGSTSDDGYSGRIGPQIDFSDNVSGYATYSRGYKGPAFNVFFNMQSRDTQALKPETSDTLEVGLKSTLLDRRLRLNAAVFDTRYKDYQANFFDTVAGAVVTRLINAGDVSTRGLEIDAEARITSQWTATAALARVRARIDDFSCPVGAAASCAVNGQPLPFSPDWRVNLGTRYRYALANGLVLDLSADYNWQSEVLYDIGQAPTTRQGAYGIANLTIGLSDTTAGWRAALLVKNLADRSYASFLQTGSAYVQRWVPRDDRRYFGVNVRYDF